MRWNISAWAIRNPAPPILFCVLLCLLGAVSFSQLPIMRYPNIDKPIITVSISDTGVAPSELETQITKKVEDAVSGVAGVRHINSTTSYGQSLTSIEFRIGTNIDAGLNDVKNAIARIRSELPVAIDEPVVERIDVQSKSLRSYGASAPKMTPEQLSWFIDNTVVRELQGLQGVGRVERVGGIDREVQVRLAPDRLMALGITASSINQLLLSTNVDLPGGKSEVGGQQQTIRTLAAAASIDDLANMKIDLSNGRKVRLGDLSTVADTGAEPVSFASVNGIPVVAFSIYSSNGASDVEVAGRLGTKIDDLARRFPDVRFSQIDDTVGYTYGNYQTAMDALYEGSALAVLVVLLFLRDWRATFIAAAALPLSAIPTFWALSAMSFSLNIISLLAITLAVGILVDDAIVEVENIVRHIQDGKSPFRAAMEATDEIGLAVIAISLTIIAIFLPVSFMSGIAGQYFKQFGLTVAVAVFFSLLVARFITPIMAAYLLRGRGAAGAEGREVYPGFLVEFVRYLQFFLPVAVLLDACFPGGIAEMTKSVPILGAIAKFTSPLGWFAVSMLVVAGAAILMSFVWTWIQKPIPVEADDGFVMRIYGWLLQATLLRGMRWIIVLVAAGSFVIALKGMADLPSDFVPEADESRIQASVELPPGSSLDETISTTNKIAKALKANRDIKNVFVIGGASSAGAEVRRASLVIGLIAKADRARSQKQIQYLVSHILADIPDIRFSFDSQEKAAVVGDDGQKVASAALNLEEAMNRDPIFVNPMVISSLSSPELRIIPDLAVANDVGITPSQISDTIRIATIGAQQSNLANFTVDGRQIPIRVELERSARASLDVLAALQVPRGNGSSVPLSSLANMEWDDGPAMIDRYDRKRLVTVGFDVPEGFTAGQASDRIPTMDVVNRFPAGVGLQATGNAEEQDQMFAQFGLAMGAGILLVLVLLILLFRNIFHPLAILSAMPLSIFGVVAALTLAKSAFSLSVTIGLLMLMGIVTKNTIMLVDFAVIRGRNGTPRKESIIDACRKRARPIVMTTIAMIAGMLPAAAGVGAGGELRAPMAIAVIGGLVASTILSLLFIPAIYTIMDDTSLLLSHIFQRIVRPNSAEDTVERPRSRDDLLAVDDPMPGSRLAAE